MAIMRILYRLLNIAKRNSYKNTSDPESPGVKYERTFEFEYTDESFPLFI